MEYEYLKELFGDSALSYAQLVEKLGGAGDRIKLVNLKDGGYVGKDKFEAIDRKSVV